MKRQTIFLPFAPLLITIACSFVFPYTTYAKSFVSLALSSQTTYGTPSAVAYNSSLWIGWMGTDDAHHLNLTYSNTNCATDGCFGNPVTTFTDTTSGGPSLATFNNSIYISWRGTDSELNVGFYNGSNVIANHTVISEYSNYSPSIAGFNGRLYLAWTGTDESLNIMSSSDGRNFGSKITLTDSAQTAPSLTVYNNRLYISWGGTDVNGQVNIGYFDGSNTLKGKNLVGGQTFDSPAITHSQGKLWAGWIQVGSQIAAITSTTNPSIFPPVQTVGGEIFFGVGLADFQNGTYLLRVDSNFRIVIGRF